MTAAAGPGERRSGGDLWKLGLPVSVLVLVGFVVAYLFVDPAPPSSLVMATGEAGGAYSRFGEAYRQALAAYDVELELRETAGSEESLALLRAGEVDVAFLQGGLATDADQERLESLGSLYYEPLWIFHRADIDPERLSDFRGLKIAVGPRGSGSRAIAGPLFMLNDVAGPFVDRSVFESSVALLAGELDVICLIASPESDIVGQLLRSEEVETFSFGRSAAYARTHRFLSEVTLPEGMIDFARNLPARDIALVAPTASLAITPDLHPALADLLVQAADGIHGAGGTFEAPGEFPTPHYIDLPLNAEAKRFYDHGPPFLQRLLPFWLATLIDRLKVMLIPLVALLIPVFRIFPPLYRWRVRSRIYRWYTELREIDPRGRADFPVEQAIRQAQRIEDEVTEVEAPASYAQELYDLRLHIEFVQRLLAERARGGRHAESDAVTHAPLTGNSNDALD